MFGVIERFSEDVDLSFDRAGLGFGGESDPLNAPTGKRREMIFGEPPTFARLLEVLQDIEGQINTVVDE